jgi:tetratricopeptide (TPR) repeat protein
MGSKACLLLSLALCAAAHAAPPEPMAEARRLHAEGATAFRLGHYQEALDRFEASYRIAGLASLLFDVGQAHRKLFEERGEVEHLKRAIELYRTFLRDAPPDAARRSDAAQLLPQLEQQLAAHERRAAAEASGRDALAIADALIAERAWDDAERAIARVLETPGNSRERVGGAWMRRGLVAAKTGAHDRAVEALERALALGASPLPDLESDPALAEAQRAIGGTTLGIIPLARAVAANVPVKIALRVAGDPGGIVERVTAVWRIGSGAWNETAAPGNAGEIALAATLPPSARLDYYLRAHGAADSLLAQAGAPDAPLQLTAPAAPPAPPLIVEHRRPWHRRWWVWTIVGGVVVAGVAIGLGVGLSSSGPPTVHVPLH